MAGSLLNLTLAVGETMEVVIPDGVKVGDIFTMTPKQIRRGIAKYHKGTKKMLGKQVRESIWGYPHGGVIAC